MSTPPDPKAELTQEQRDAIRRKREFKAIIAIGITLGLLFLFEATFIDFRGSIGQSNLLFFTLININVILACVLLFLILRNVSKLLFERRRKVLGAQLRTRLVVAFVTFALVPTIILFYVAWSFISNSIERWFSLQIEQSLEESLKVAQSYYNTFEEMAIAHADELTAMLAKQKDFVDNTGPVSDAIADAIAERRRLLDVDAIEVYRSPKAKPFFVVSDQMPDEFWNTEELDMIRKGFSGKSRGSEVVNLGEAEIVRGSAPLVNDNGAVVAVVVISYFVPQSLVQKMRTIQKTYEEYRQLVIFESPIRTNYLIILALIYMFIFFSATWFGFYLARQITEPLQRLADGARRFAGGESGVQIEKVAEDEMGLLVDVFNRMWAELDTSRNALEHAMSDLEQTNVELERRRSSMETILANVAAGVLAFDNEGQVTTCNPSAERILGIRAKEALNKTWLSLFPPEMSEAFEKLAEQMRIGHRQTVQAQVEITVTGERRTVLAILTALRNKQGQATGAVLVVDDLTELLKVQRMAAWQEIARRIAHEIKNPLTPIQLAAQRLQKRYGDRFDREIDSVFYDSTGTIVRQVEELKQMVKEFSDFARIAEAKPAPTEIADVIREAVILYSEAHKRIKFHTKIDGAMPRMMIDRDQMKRAFINVLDNAIGSIEGSGEVNIGAWMTEGGKTVRIEIADTGKGIPKAYRSRLFEPYFSTKKMGTGLGLAIVHRIIQDHGGSVRLRDNQPKGTIVAIELPVRSEEHSTEISMPSDDKSDEKNNE